MFSQQSLDFLFENRLRDSRDWFTEHRNDYRRLILEPLGELVTALAPAMLEIDGEFVTEPRVDRTISRIWRDTRYARDKSLYRDNMWIIFKRGDRMHGTEYPGYYFEVNCAGFNYGMGFYSASTAYLETMRSLILAGDRTFEAAQRAFSSQSVFHMEGECFKRPHFPRQPEELRQWLERRNLCFCSEDSRDLSLLFSDRLSSVLTEDFRRLAPVYRFLLSAAQK